MQQRQQRRAIRATLDIIVPVGAYTSLTLGALHLISVAKRREERSEENIEQNSNFTVSTFLVPTRVHVHLLLRCPATVLSVGWLVALLYSQSCTAAAAAMSCGGSARAAATAA